jgi:hypothetical protein
MSLSGTRCQFREHLLLSRVSACASTVCQGITGLAVSIDYARDVELLKTPSRWPPTLGDLLRKQREHIAYIRYPHNIHHYDVSHQACRLVESCRGWILRYLPMLRPMDLLVFVYQA